MTAPYWCEAHRKCKRSGHMVMSGAAGQQVVARAASGHEAGTSGRTQEAPSQDLAYSIEAPESYEEFDSLVAGRSAVDLSAAIKRIMACSAVALAAQNRRKMQARLCALSDLAGGQRSLSAIWALHVHGVFPCVWCGKLSNGTPYRLWSVLQDMSAHLTSPATKQCSEAGHCDCRSSMASWCSTLQSWLGRRRCPLPTWMPWLPSSWT